MNFITIKPASFVYYYLPILVIAFAGVANMVYLAISHYRVYTDIGYESFCAISRSINCDTVSQSSYSIFLNVPVAIWGTLAHLLVFYIVVLAGTRFSYKARMWPLLFWISLFFSLYSLFLAYVSTFYIKSYCLMCILGYLVNFSLLYYAWFINRRFGNTGLIRGVPVDLKHIKSHKKSAASIILILLFFSTTAPFWFPQYWQLKEPKPAHSLTRGITEDGHPWIGAEEPALVIMEFTDYMCFQCRKMHYYLRRLIETHPDKIRLVHRHFPMDHQYNPLVKEPYHVGAGALAIMAIHAKENGVFWHANDYFYAKGALRESINTLSVASALGLTNTGLVNALNDHEYLAGLFTDIKAGLELGITATPSYLIDGKLYEGQIPPKIITEALR